MEYRWVPMWRGHPEVATSELSYVDVARRITIQVFTPGTRQAPVVLVGQVAPHRGRYSVVLQRYGAGRWRTIQRVQLTRQGKYRTEIRRPAANAKYRVWCPADRYNVAGVSPEAYTPSLPLERLGGVR